MAAARGLRWGLNRAGAWLLPPPAHCARRELHKQVDGTEFQSIYSLDKLYPESRGVDTAWRVPVSREGQTEGAFPRLRRGTLGSRGSIGRARGSSEGPRWKGAGCLSNRGLGPLGRSRRLGRLEVCECWESTSFSASVPQPSDPDPCPKENVGILALQNGQ